jgi:hypothetical protein
MNLEGNNMKTADTNLLSGRSLMLLEFYIS